jgi:DNA repair exonuclease SbcCD nuclease subunit
MIGMQTSIAILVRGSGRTAPIVVVVGIKVMARFIFTADLHLHNWPDCSETLENGFNSRFVDGLDVLREILSYALEHEIDCVVFGGDLFHDRSTLPVEFVGSVIKVFAKYTRAGLKIYAYPGNHDYSVRVSSRFSIDLLRAANVCVVGVAKRLALRTGSGTLDVAFVPYQRNTQELHRIMRQMRKKPPDVLFMHQGVQGVQSRSGYVLMGEPLKKEWLIDCLTLSGHIHESQLIGTNFYYVGSPLQLDWGDSCIPKHFFDVELASDDCFVVREVAVNAPKFVNLSTRVAFDSGVVRGNFVRYICENQKELRDAKNQEERLLKYAPAYIAPALLSAKTLMGVGYGKGEPLSLSDMIDAYVDSGDDTNKDTLKKVGKEILRRCDSSN